jgi:hypothetical protein
MAGRLLALGKDALINPAGLCALRDNTKIAEWAIAQVPEFVGIKVAKEEAY